MIELKFGIITFHKSLISNHYFKSINSKQMSGYTKKGTVINFSVISCDNVNGGYEYVKNKS